MQFTLEKYSGTNSRHVCPNCNARREFSRYVDASGNYLADDVGKCNRESKCGYHKKPTEYFAENPRMAEQGFKRNNPPKSLVTSKKTGNKPDFIAVDVLQKTLSNYEQNSFVQFLINLFPDDIEAVREIVQKYLIGTWKEFGYPNSETLDSQKQHPGNWKDKLNIFWQIDQNGKIRTGKLMRVDVQSGKRQAVKTWIENGETCELKIYWIHKVLIKQKQLHADFKLKQCFFGEHLLRKEPEKIVAIVEAEKTAIIASLCFSEMLWLAVGAKGYLQAERLKIFANPRVLLFPDADAYSDWKEKAVRAQRNGFDVRISNIIETHGTDAEKQSGFDLADYLIAEIKRKNQAKTAYQALIENSHFCGWTNASLF